jgi:hypothetical protein
MPSALLPVGAAQTRCMLGAVATVSDVSVVEMPVRSARPWN